MAVKAQPHPPLVLNTKLHVLLVNPSKPGFSPLHVVDAHGTLTGHFGNGDEEQACMST